MGGEVGAPRLYDGVHLFYVVGRHNRNITIGDRKQCPL
jgi:hypothetical protein